MTCELKPLRPFERISLTGADDQVRLADLEQLGREFPFVEWALLYMPGKEGAPRNPTQAWREAFFEAGPPGFSAVHLCGAAAFDQLLAGELPHDIARADRLQLNINARGSDFADAVVLEVFARALALGPDVILQYHGGTAAVIERFLARLEAADRSRVHVLLDESRGKGVLPDRWTVPAPLKPSAPFVGFAGGLGPGNIEAVLADVTCLGVQHWLDMESGIRTDDQFDLAKARAVLAGAAPWWLPVRSGQRARQALR